MKRHMEKSIWMEALSLLLWKLRDNSLQVSVHCRGNKLEELETVYEQFRAVVTLGSQIHSEWSGTTDGYRPFSIDGTGRQAEGAEFSAMEQ